MSEPVAINHHTPPDLLSTHDLLVAVTGRAEARLVADRPLHELAEHTPAELRAAGLTAAQARKVAAAFELARRLQDTRLVPGVTLRSAEEVFEAFDGRLRPLKLEQFWAVLLDGRSRVQREVLVSQGTLTASLVHPREVFRVAIKEAAADLVLVHNHPSGDPEPSPEDLEITRRLCAVGELVGIRIRDHVVLGGGGYVSLLGRGLMG